MPLTEVSVLGIRTSVITVRHLWARRTCRRWCGRWPAGSDTARSGAGIG